MRFLTADYLFPLHISPIKEGILQISDKGEVVAVFENRSDISAEKLEVFDGFLCPGFVNAHCHLELSHLEGIVEKGKGFLDFIEAIQQRNKFSNDEIQYSIDKAEQQMLKNGIVGVGDICNTIDTLVQKQKTNLQYYNFIETFQVHDDKIESTLKDSLQIRNAFREIGQKATLVPHAPYSVLPKLMKEIARNFDSEDELLTIHMQETIEENELFETKSGKFYQWLNSINASSLIWEKRNKSKDILEELANKKTLLVHNTFSTKKEMMDNFYCTCPKANLYIENSLPDYSIFNAKKLCVGTDSLASNNSFSILEELLIIQENSDFDMNTLLKIAAKNGADTLGFKNLGTFEKGKIPGVNLIQNLDAMKLIETSFLEII